jgi:hypothetical protein
MISKRTTRRAFLIGLGVLGLGTLAYWFLKSVEFGKVIEGPVTTSSLTSTLTPTSTSTPTSTPQPTTTPTSTPTPTLTPTPTINREEVERLKSRYKEILVKEYPTLWELLNSPSPPIIVNYSDVVRKYFVKRNWIETKLTNGDRSFLFAVQPEEDGKIRIILLREVKSGLYNTKTLEDRLEIEAFEGIKDRSPVDEVIWVLDETPFNELRILIIVKTASLNEEIETTRINSKLVLEVTPGEGKICRWCVVEIAGWNMPKSRMLTEEEKEKKYYLASVFLVILMERLISKTSNTFKDAENVKNFLNNYRLYHTQSAVLESETSFQAILELILEIMKKWEK